MASIPSNSISQSPPITNPRAPEKPKGYRETAAEIANAIIQTPKTIKAYGKYWFVAAENPKNVLKEIDRVADRGLRRAAVRGVGVRSEEVQRFFSAASSNVPTVPNTSVNNPADIPPVIDDSDVTCAPNLQTRVDNIYWPDEMTKQRDRLIKKTAVFATLLQMCWRSGLDTNDKLPLMVIVRKLTEENQGKTLWSLFREHYPDITFTQKLKAGWFYCLYYLTSVITNTVSAYLEAAIKNLTEDLVTNSEKRTLVFRKFLENINQFLVDDIHATKDFAFEKEYGDLKDLRNRAIERPYNPTQLQSKVPLLDLCKTFSNSRIDQDETTVPILRSFQKIPLVGRIFKVFEDFVNRYIIRGAMKSMVLPYALESMVTNGLETTQPHNLAFRLSLTRFLTSLLEKFKKELDSGTPASSQVEALPGTELLDPVVKHLMMALELEPLKTAPELRKKFQEIEKGKRTGDQVIEERIKTSIIEGSHLLFKYLSETAQSRELFARLLELSCEPFSMESNSATTLKTNFDAANKKLIELSQEVVDKVVKSAVSKAFSGHLPEVSKKVAEKTIDSKKALSNKVFGKLNQLCERMSEKINRSSEPPIAHNNTQQYIDQLLRILDETNTQGDISLFLQYMQAFVNQKEIQQEIEKLDLNALDRDAIWRLIHPLYQKALKIENRVLDLQELQDKYPSHATVEIKLRLINNLLISNHSEFLAQPRHYQLHWIRTLREHAEKISQCLGPEAKETTAIQWYINKINTHSNTVVNGQKVIDAIDALYPPREEGEVVEREGLLEQMLNYQRGIHPRGFKPSVWREEIDKNLEHFPETEREALRTLIGNGSNLRADWGRLGTILQRVYQQYMTQKNQGHAGLNSVLGEATRWTQKKITKYCEMKDKNRAEMQEKIRLLSQEMNSLKNEAMQAKLDIPLPLSSAVTRFTSGSLFSLLGGGMGWFIGGPVGVISGAGAGAAVGEYLYTGPDAGNKKAVKYTAGAALGAVASGIATWIAGPSAPLWYYGSTAAGTLGSVFAGWHAKNAGQALSQDQVNTKVTDLFKSATNLSMENPRIYKAFATRVLKELS